MKKKTIYISLVILFITCMLLVITDNTILVDEQVHNFLYRDNLVETMKIITFFGGTIGIPLITGIVFIILFLKNKRRDAFGLIIVVVSVTIINYIAKILIARERPEYILINESLYSFPSGHAMGSTALYGYIIYLIIKSTLNTKNKAILTSLFALLIISIGISRIILGAHYFSDILGGIVLSTMIIIIYYEINKHLENKNK